MANAVASYFALERAVLGGKSGVKSEVALFSGVVAGCAAQWLFLALRTGEFLPAKLAIGLIASIVIFPTIFYKAGLDQDGMNFVKWCVAFQNGFFWPTLIEQISQTLV